jgi:hypothetical protein
MAPDQEYFDKKFERLDNGLYLMEQRIEKKIDQKIEWLARMVANGIANPYQKQLDNHETRISKLEQNKTVA